MIWRQDRTSIGNFLFIKFDHIRYGDGTAPAQLISCMSQLSKKRKETAVHNTSRRKAQTSSSPMAMERAAPLARRDRLPVMTGQGSRRRSARMSCSVISHSCTGCRNRLFIWPGWGAGAAWPGICCSKSGFSNRTPGSSSVNQQNYFFWTPSGHTSLTVSKRNIIHLYHAKDFLLYVHIIWYTKYEFN